MPGPLSRFLRAPNPDGHHLDLLRQAVSEKWDITEEERARVKENLVAIATNKRQPGRAMKAVNILQRGIANDRKNQLEWAKLIMQDEAMDDRPPAQQQIRNQVNVVADISLDDVHGILQAFHAPRSDDDDLPDSGPPAPLALP